MLLLLLQLLHLPNSNINPPGNENTGGNGSEDAGGGGGRSRLSTGNSYSRLSTKNVSSSAGGGGSGSGATRQTTMDDFPRTRHKPGSAPSATSTATSTANSAAVSARGSSHNPYQRNASGISNNAMSVNRNSIGSSSNASTANNGIMRRNDVTPIVDMDTPRSSSFHNNSNSGGNRYQNQNPYQQNRTQQIPGGGSSTIASTPAPNPYASLRPSNPSRFTAPNPVGNVTASRNEQQHTSNNSQSLASDLTDTPSPMKHRATTTSSQESSSSHPSKSLSGNTFISIINGKQNTNPNNTIDGNNNDTINLSFRELQDLLEKIKNDKSMYNLYFGKTFEVPCKMSPGEDKQFNIVKADKKKKKLPKGEKKYEFLLVSPFIGSFSADGSIACRVESALMEPYFPHEPGELRKMSRASPEEKDRANKVVNRCSLDFIHDYKSLGKVSMKLLLTAEEFYENIQSQKSPNWMADTHNPFMAVIKREA